LQFGEEFNGGANWKVIICIDHCLKRVVRSDAIAVHPELAFGRYVIKLMTAIGR
jgi:hypothetical protein